MMLTHVECYSGSRYAERPIAVYLRGQRVEVAQVLRSWRTPSGLAFDVVLVDGRRLRLELAEATDTWTVTPGNQQ